MSHGEPVLGKLPTKNNGYSGAGKEVSTGTDFGGQKAVARCLEVDRAAQLYLKRYTVK